MSPLYPNDSFMFPGPAFNLDLSALDARHPVHYSRRLLIFRCQSTEHRESQLVALKAGLQAFVQRCPSLGGVITPPDPGNVSIGDRDWSTIVPGPGIELLVKDLSTEIASFTDLEVDNFQPSQFPFHLLVPVPEEISKDRSFAAFKMQYTAIKGGTILTWAMSHSVADGSGTNEMMHVLSQEVLRAQQKLTRGSETNISEATSLFEDRSPLRNITSNTPFKIEDHPAYMQKPASPANVLNHPFENSSPEIPILICLSPAGLAQLKFDATTPGEPPISTHDALSALIWRTTILIRSQRSEAARKIPASTRTTLFMPSDARRHLGLTTSYIGNAVYQLVISTDLGTLLSPRGLQRGASALRSAIQAVNPALVSSYFTELKKGWIDWQFMNGTISSTGVAMGTDWSSHSLYNDDWGDAFGPLIRYRFPAAAFCNVNPKLPDGSAEVVMGVMPGELSLLKGGEGFGKYIAI